jgi:hypothetical protein
MPSHTARRVDRLGLQADRTREPPRDAAPIENKDHAVAIAAQLRAMIRYSTDPAWLEKMAREAESTAHRRA